MATEVVALPRQTLVSAFALARPAGTGAIRCLLTSCGCLLSTDSSNRSVLYVPHAYSSLPGKLSLSATLACIQHQTSDYERIRLAALLRRKETTGEA